MKRELSVEQGEGDIAMTRLLVSLRHLDLRFPVFYHHGAPSPRPLRRVYYSRRRHCPSPCKGPVGLRVKEKHFWQQGLRIRLRCVLQTPAIATMQLVAPRDQHYGNNRTKIRAQALKMKSRIEGETSIINPDSRRGEARLPSEEVQKARLPN